MGKMLSELGIEGLIALNLVLFIIIAILGIVIICLSWQINKMIKESAKKDLDYRNDINAIMDSLADCENEKKKLERQKESAEATANDYKKQCDELIKSQKFPAGPAGWNVVFKEKENNE